MRELTGAPPGTALALYGFIALFNGLGRFFWGAVSDRIGRNLTYLLIYLVQVVIFFVVGGLHSLPVVAALFAIVLLCYGGGFGTMPSFTADYFGTKYMGVNYGWILSAWGTGSFSGALPVIGVMLLAASILPLLTRKPGEKRERPFYRGLLRRAWVALPLAPLEVNDVHEDRRGEGEHLQVGFEVREVDAEVVGVGEELLAESAPALPDGPASLPMHADLERPRLEHRAEQLGDDLAARVLEMVDAADPAPLLLDRADERSVRPVDL
jgi:MFS family permease